MVHERLRDEERPVHAVARRVARRRRRVEARVARECELGDRAGEPSADLVAVWVHDRDPEQGGRLGIRGGVAVVGAHELRVEGRELLDAAQEPLEQRRREPRLFLDVEAGEHQGHRVAVARVEVEGDLERVGGRLALCAEDPDTVLADLGELDRVEARGDVGVLVARRAKLVEQLGGDRAGRDRAARVGLLGHDARAVGRHLADREAWVARVQLVEEGVVAPGRLGAALDDVAGDDRARERVEVLG